jgi:hypothetical protein
MVDAFEMRKRDALRKEFYDSFSRSAQRAWDRLLTQHLPKLPLPARLMIAHAMFLVRAGTDGHYDVLESVVADIVPMLESGTLTLDTGRGILWNFADEILVIFYQAARLKLTLPGLFAGDFAGVSRRLVLILYYHTLDKYKSGRKAFEMEDVYHVSAEREEGV